MEKICMKMNNKNKTDNGNLNQRLKTGIKIREELTKLYKEKMPDNILEELIHVKQYLVLLHEFEILKISNELRKINVILKKLNKRLEKLENK